MTAITICSNFGAPTKNKVSYCFHSNRQNLTVKAYLHISQYVMCSFQQKITNRLRQETTQFEGTKQASLSDFRIIILEI